MASTTTEDEVRDCYARSMEGEAEGYGAALSVSVSQEGCSEEAQSKFQKAREDFEKEYESQTTSAGPQMVTNLWSNLGKPRS